jgi:uncharacterized protein
MKQKIQQSDAVAHLRDEVVANMRHSYMAISKRHGIGLFASKELNPGDFLGKLDGQIIESTLHKNLQLTYEWNAIDERHFLVRPYRTFYSYINHDRRPNLIIRYNPMRVIVADNILEDEELTLDYRKEYLPSDYIEKKGKGYL